MRRIVDVTIVVPIPDDVVLIAPMRPTLDCVVYRTGGTANFTWHRSLAMTPDEALLVFEDVRRMGYVCMIENFYSSLAIGLPETFSPDFPLEQDWQ